MTLAQFIAKLRADARLSMRELVTKTRPRLDPTVVWKLENGRPVRAKTLGRVLRALGLRETDDAYVQAFALWSTEQAKTLPLASVDRGLSRVRKARTRELDALIAAIERIPERDWPVVLEALERPQALKLWVQSTQDPPARVPRRTSRRAAPSMPRAGGNCFNGVPRSGLSAAAAARGASASSPRPA